MGKNKKTIALVDGHSLAHQAIHGVRNADLRASDGTPTGGAYTFLQMLSKLIRQTKPDYLCIAKDGPREDLVRRKWHPSYKAHRTTSSETHEQVELVYELAGALGVSVVTAKGWEADDILATLARKARLWDLRVRVFSSDKDLLQIVNKDVFVYCPKKQSLRGPKDVEAIWAVPPKKVPDIQALAGDPVDGYAGVPGVGIKKATDLIHTFGDLAGVYSNMGRHTASVRRSLEQHDPAHLLRMARMNDRVALPPFVKLHKFEFDGLNYKQARPLLNRLEIRTPNQ